MPGLQRLSGLDASFLYLETAVQPLHVCSILELDTSTMPGGYTFDRLRDGLALRIKASNQLSGSLDSFNAIAHRYAPDWDGSTWVDALTRNPASAYAAALTGPAARHRGNANVAIVSSAAGLLRSGTHEVLERIEALQEQLKKSQQLLAHVTVCFPLVLPSFFLSLLASDALQRGSENSGVGL